MEPLTREGQRAAAGGGAKKAVPGENAMDACARRGPDMDGENGIGGSGGGEEVPMKKEAWVCGYETFRCAATSCWWCSRCSAEWCCCRV